MYKRVRIVSAVLFLLASSAYAQTSTPVTTVGGTPGTIPYFNGGSTLVDSLIYQSAGEGYVAINGNLTVNGILNVTTSIGEDLTENSQPALLMFHAANSFLAGAGNTALTNTAIDAANAVLDSNGDPNNHYNGNLGIGYGALQATTPVGGGGNTAIGVSALTVNTTGLGNIAIGGSALVSNTTGQLNMALGSDAMYNNQTGSSNVAIGTYALDQGAGGSNNVAIGNAAGEWEDGSNQFYLGNVGQNSGPTGNRAVNDRAFSLLWGTFAGDPGILTGQQLTVNGAFNVNGGASIGSTYVGTAAPANGAIIQGNVGIGTSTPAVALDVNGTVRAQAIVFPDNSTLTSASSLGSGGGAPITSVGTITSGIWHGDRLGPDYVPADIVYAGTSQTISGQKNFTSNVGIGTSAPGSLLQVGAPNQQIGGTIINSTDVNGSPLPLEISDNTNGLTFIGNTFGRQIRLSRNNNTFFYDIGLDSSNQFFIMNRNSTTEGFVINSSGNVGIGTATPGASLDVNGNVKISGTGANVTFPDNTVQATAWNGTTLGGDYAESIDVLGDRATYEPGDVITMDASAPGKFTKSQEPYSKLVSGVFSTKPGLTGRRVNYERPDKAAEVPMAMMGIVPTKVSTENGPIKVGDLLVSSTRPGYAMKGTDRDQMLGAVIGKALAPLNSGSGVIEVLITLQ